MTRTSFLVFASLMAWLVGTACDGGEGEDPPGPWRQSTERVVASIHPGLHPLFIHTRGGADDRVVARRRAEWEVDLDGDGSLEVLLLAGEAAADDDPGEGPDDHLLKNLSVVVMEQRSGAAEGVTGYKLLVALPVPGTRLVGIGPLCNDNAILLADDRAGAAMVFVTSVGGLNGDYLWGVGWHDEAPVVFTSERRDRIWQFEGALVRSRFGRDDEWFEQWLGRDGEGRWGVLATPAGEGNDSP